VNRIFNRLDKAKSAVATDSQAMIQWMVMLLAKRVNNTDPV